MSTERPREASERADALGSSRHSRLSDQVQKPEGNDDLARAIRICAEVSRATLGDFAPALLLLPAQLRRRVQALTAYASTLYDFARQGGLDGERLAQINRWEFDLEQALEGEPAPQPVFLTIAEQERLDPWPREGFERLNGCARRRVATTRPETTEDAEREALRWSYALASLVLGSSPAAETVALGGAVFRIASLRSLGEGLRRHDARLARSELPDRIDLAESAGQEQIEASIQAECARLRRIFGGIHGGHVSDPSMQKCQAYLHLAGLALVARTEQLGAGIVDQPPRLGIGARLGLLVRARFGLR